MIDIVEYSEKHRKPVYDLIMQFETESLGEYGHGMTMEDIEALEDEQTTFVMTEDDKVIGLISGEVGKLRTSTKLVFQESIWYVHKDHRKDGAKLLRHLENWCTKNGIGQIIMAFMHNSMGDRLYDFYIRMGFKPIETHLIRDVG